MNHEFRSMHEFVKNAHPELRSYDYSEVAYRMGIRWYVGKKKRIIKGKTSNNLSDFYVGPVGEIGFANGGNDTITIRNAQFYSLGFNAGYQTRLLKNLYINFHFGIMMRDYYNPDVYGIKELIGIRGESVYIDKELISEVTEPFEILPIGGLLVGYTF